MKNPLKLERILCPTDLSPDSDEALRYALALARAYEAKLILLYCEQPGDAVSANHGRAKRVFEPSLFTHLDANELAMLNWEGVITQGDDVGAMITEQAAERAADVIVMRSRRRPHRAALLGSTAESVCRTAPCPVLVTHPDEREWVGVSTCEIDLRRVLVAYDFSEDAEMALNHALSLAQEYQSEMHLLHVIPSYATSEPEISWYPLGQEGAYHKAARRLHKAVPAEAHLWCNIKHAVSEGEAYREILNYAENNKIDLICIGAHGAGFGLRALFGSNVDRVLRQAPCPVLVARPLRPSKARIMGSEARASEAVRVQARR